MRQIKFRAWVQSENCMIYHREVVERAHLQFNDDIGGHNDIVMQYTGFVDKIGMGIYESDILLTLDGIAIVEFDKSMGMFALKSPGSNAMDYDLFLVASKSKILGNIFENPELMK